MGYRYSPQDPAARTILKLDTNKDGRIDPNEIAAFAIEQGLDADSATKEFSGIDLNQDGVLDSVELQNVFGDTPSQQLAAKQVAVSAQPSYTSAHLPNSIAAPSGSGWVPPSTIENPLPPLGTRSVAPSLLTDESRDSAQKAAQEVSEQLLLEQSEEQKARELDSKAMDARAQSNSLAKQTVQAAADASAKAAEQTSNQIMAQIAQIEAKLEAAELKAAALHAKAQIENQQANELMSAADQALRHA
jgi:hypothetical protein